MIIHLKTDPRGQFAETEVEKGIVNCSLLSSLIEACHREPARTLVWRSPGHSGNFRGLPRQSADWLAMTCVVYGAAEQIVKLQFLS